jgi:hypothetical protein
MRLRRGAAVVSIALCGLFGLANDDWNVPQCREVPHGVRRLGWGLYGIRFDARKDEVAVRLGKPDVDYIVDVVKPKGSQAVLALWFGVNAWGVNAARNDIKNSERVSQRRINGGWGLDSRGRTADGRYWRSAGLQGEGGAVYRDVSPVNAKVLDRVIDSMCVVPYPDRQETQ